MRELQRAAQRGSVTPGDKAKVGGSDHRGAFSTVSEPQKSSSHPSVMESWEDKELKEASPLLGFLH